MLYKRSLAPVSNRSRWWLEVHVTLSAPDLLQQSAADVSLAPPFFSAVVEALMDQDQVVMVMGQIQLLL